MVEDEDCNDQQRDKKLIIIDEESLNDIFEEKAYNISSDDSQEGFIEREKLKKEIKIQPS